MYIYFFFFFFQAEDGIRDYKVTGVQTCALPISGGGEQGLLRRHRLARGGRRPDDADADRRVRRRGRGRQNGRGAGRGRGEISGGARLIKKKKKKRKRVGIKLGRKMK